MIDKKSVPLDQALAQKLLELLSEDDGFREKFAEDPTVALTSIGYEPGQAAALSMARTDGSIEEPFATCSVNKLASKEVIKDSLEQLRSTLTQGLAYTTPTFEVSTLGDSRNLK